ncbi:MAG TPA: M36 family metallopeptidase [Pyrinomonadaceae bacterium]|nr:M36 family metallopeptidase [Pyrinomonadaceae bacterium]
MKYKRSAQRLKTVAVFLLLFSMVWGSVPRIKAQTILPGDGDAPAETNGRRKAGREYYDIREHDAAKAHDKAERRRQKANKARKNKENRGQQMKEARERLAESNDDADVQVNEELGLPEVVGVKHGRTGKFLTRQSGESHEKVVRGFLGHNASLYGLTARQVAHLKKTADYTNPEGNLSWVELRQEVKGIPVFQGELRAMITKDGELARTVGRLVPDLDDTEVIDGGDVEVPATQLSAAQAVAAGAETLGLTVNPEELVLKESSPDGTSFVFESGPFAEEIRVDLTYFPLESGAVTPSWSMTLWQDPAAYYTLIDADEGSLVWQKNITDQQTQSATYSVYDGDSPAPISPSNALPGLNVQGAQVPRVNITNISEHPANNLGWLTDGATTTTGNNVDAGLDIDSVVQANGTILNNGIDANGRPVSPTRNFVYDYNPAPGLPGALGSTSPTDVNYRWGAVTNLFFWSNRYHDRLYSLGFTEAARNFQQDNFGRNPTGLNANARNGVDRVRAEAQDSSGTNNANFSTPADGSAPRMQMYIWPNTTPRRDGDLDQEIVLHELTHGTSNRLHANASGLASTISRGMGEGWSDFYARSLLSSADEDVDGIYAMGAYATHLATTGYTNNAYYGIRRFPYAVKTNVGPNGKPHNPLTLADTNVNTIDLTDGAFARGPFGAGGRAGAVSVHNIGEVWCMALFEVRARMIKRLGYAVGNQRMLQLVTDAMKIDPINPTLIDGRNSLLAADAAGLNNEDEQDIWAGFATRGMGFGATMSTVNVNGKESFDNPVPGMGAVTFNDASCNANGIADRGEDLILSIPMTNPLHTTITNVSATINGETASYGDLAPGQTTTKQILYTVPADAPCGDSVTVTVVVDSSLGQQTKTFPIQISGTANVTYSENFDGVTAPALPAGWSALVAATTPPSPVWRTVNTSSQSAPNAAFAAFLATTSLSALQSAVIPITSANAELTFRHSYNSEFEWDGGVLEISLDGGTTFTDILTAGGTFVEGGYTFALVSSADGNTNPLFSRAAWTGNSNGFITTRVKLPAAAAGKNVRFRWIHGADGGTTPANAGWFIDNVAVVQGYQCPVSNCVADLSATQTVAPNPVTTGSDLTYNITVTNNGPARATDVTVTDNVPAGTTFQSATAPAGWSMLTPNVGEGGTVTFTKASLAAGDPAFFTLVVKTDCGVATGTNISNTVTVAGSRPDTNTDNNSSTVGAGASDPAPVLNLPANIVQPTDPGQPTAIVNYNVTADDNCPGVTLESSHLSGSAFPIGTTTVTVTATDATGNKTTGTFTVTINDPQLPAVSNASVDKPSLWSPNHQMENVVVSYDASDNSGAVTTTLSVTSNEPINGTGDGDTGPDWEVVNNHLVRLRAERAGGGTGRIYTITITATDASGNQTSQTVTVQVPKSQKK